MTKLALKGLLSRKLRSVLTGFAVVIGVAFVVGTLVFTDTIDASFKNLFERTQQGVDVSRRGAPGGQGRLLGAADDARRHAGEGQGDARASRSPRAASAPTARCWTSRARRSSPTARRRWSSRPRREKIFQVLDYVEGGPPQSADEVALDRGTAKKFGFKVGDTVTVSRRRAGQAVQGLRHRHARRQGQPRRRAAGRR